MQSDRERTDSVPTLGMRFDMRVPEWAARPQALYAAALDLAAHADRHGFDFLMISEHHGAEDGYCPSPLMLASAFAARTSRIRLRIAALVLPLYHPLRVAEDVAVLDLVSGGRAEAVLGAGYREAEFRMLGADFAARGRLLDEGVEVLLQAWTGEPFQFRGEMVRVTPSPVQRPHPRLLIGGSSRVAARRAARLGLEFVPTDATFFAAYQAERAARGLPPGPEFQLGPYFLHVAEDPERDWRRIAPHALHDVDTYARWNADAHDSQKRMFEGTSADDLRKGSRFKILDPAGAVRLIRDLGEDSIVQLHPLMGGMDPDLGWASAELFMSKVLPELGMARGVEETV